jgi:hypothetical protein
MEIPINADVICKEGSCGRSTYIVLDPIKDTVTHFVVEDTSLPNIEYLVPIQKIEASNHEKIYLKCRRTELENMEPFIETDFIRANSEEYFLPFDYPYTRPLMVWPYVGLSEDVMISRLVHVPPSELAVRRGASVRASDGYVGEVDEFIVNPDNGHITHLILRKGHLWAEKDVTIPVSQIDRLDENDVYLKLNKSEVAALPAIPIQRRRFKSAKKNR